MSKICKYCGKEIEFKIHQQFARHSLECKRRLGLIEQKQSKQRISYDFNPKFCFTCGEKIPYEKRENKYCNHICSATETNKLRVGQKRIFSTDGIENIKKSNKERKIQFEKNYNTNPKLCSICNQPIPIKKRNKDTCSYDCGKIKMKKNISLTRKKLFKDGKLNVTGGTTKWFFIKLSNKKKIKVQGSYEVRVCFILEKMKHNGQILDWEYTLDRIEYIGLDERKHNYLLDFKVWITNSNFYYIESKGRFTETCKLKICELENKKLKYELWMKKDIEAKEIELKIKNQFQYKYECCYIIG